MARYETAETAASVPAPPAPEHGPRHLTFSENVILTIKVLALAGGLIAILWGLSVWTSTK